ncbi:MAG: NAD(P)/FAD-dependent oxidoreductase [Crocinitomicaceae bacterium]
MNKKVCVIGNGLAGACVSYHLIKAGFEVTVFDNGENHSSVVAAGLITPLVFRRMNKSWRVDEFIGYLVPFYRSFETFDQEVLRNIPLRRMFASDQERGYWLERQNTPEYSAYMAQVNSEDDTYPHAINNFGSGRVQNCYAVNAKPFFSRVDSFIRANGRLIEEAFDYEKLMDNTYEEETFDAFVFCEGFMNYLNPFFKDIPVGQTKGDVLTIKAETIPDGQSLNRKCFMLPLGNHKFKVGSTYSWNEPNPIPTDEGKHQILEKLAYITPEKVEVLEHLAGVRPTTMDRRPIIGKHRTKDNLYLFNGLGTKGYMYAPLLAKEFVDHLLNGTPLHEEVLIERYLVK